MHNGRHIKEETVYGCKGKLYLLKCKDSFQIIWGITEQVSFQKYSERAWNLASFKRDGPEHVVEYHIGNPGTLKICDFY